MELRKLINEIFPRYSIIPQTHTKSAPAESKKKSDNIVQDIFGAGREQEMVGG